MNTQKTLYGGLVLLAATLLSGAAIAQPVPVGGGIVGGAGPQSRHPTGLIKTPAEVMAKIPAVPKYRDFLPVAVDLSNYFPNIGDQAQQGSCVAWSTGFAARAYYAEVVEHRDISKPENVPSPAFIYDAVHQAGPANSPCTGGSSAADALQLLKTHGVASLADFPYDGRDDASACAYLSDAQMAKGADFKIDDFEQVPTWEDVRSELAQGNPVIVGASLDDGFMSLHGPQGAGMWTSGPIDPKAPYDGHEFVLIGYDDQLQEFKFINSWSPEWGDNGFGRVSYATAQNRIDEAFVIRMPGDPTITLAAEDFRSDVVNQFLPTQVTAPSLGAASLHGPAQVAGLWCGRAEVVKSSDGKLAAQGFVGTEAEKAKITAQFGADVDLSGVELAPWPLCETRLTLGNLIGGDSAPVAKITAAADGTRALSLATPADARFVYAVSYGADGTVNVLTDLRPTGSIGGAQVQGTLGKDAANVLVVASDQSILDTIPPGEEIRDFLSQLRDGVLRGANAHIAATLISSSTP
jgi:hypothetical protein